MNKRALAISFLSFLIIMEFSSAALASGSAFSTQKDEELVWSCNTCNVKEMGLIFGQSWNSSGFFSSMNQGDQMKWKIISVDNINLKLTVDFWTWTANGIWGVKTNQTTLTMPSIKNTNYIFDDYIPLLVPSPAGNYLAGLSLHQWYDVDHRVLPTLMCNIKKDEIGTCNPTKDIYIVAIFNDQGILSSYKLYINDYQVIVDISLGLPLNKIVPFFILILVIFFMGSLIIIKTYALIFKGVLENFKIEKSS